MAQRAFRDTERSCFPSTRSFHLAVVGAPVVATRATIREFATPAVTSRIEGFAEERAEDAVPNKATIKNNAQSAPPVGRADRDLESLLTTAPPPLPLISQRVAATVADSRNRWSVSQAEVVCRLPRVTRRFKSAPWLVVGAALATLLGAGAAMVSPAQAKSRCTVTVSPGHGLQRFVDSLAPGAVGCLTPGTYDARKLLLRTHGKAGAVRTLRSSDPRRRATIKGLVWVTNRASYWTLEDLNFDGRNRRNLPSPIVNGSHTTWRRDDITNYHAGVGTKSGGICFMLGDTSRWGIPHDTTIVQSRIHDCGIADNGNHGIYIQATSGTTLIANSWIYRNGDRGIQLFPDAAHVHIVRNVIDGNGSGVIFSGTGPYASHHNIVSGNIISNSQIRWNVESWYPNGTGSAVGNIVAGNCFWATNPTPLYDRDGGIAPPDGFTVASNVVERPLYFARQRNDLRLVTGSGCDGYGPRRDVEPLWRTP